jgi:hypothetical protein
VSEPLDVTMWVSNVFGERSIPIHDYRALRIEKIHQGAWNLSFELRSNDPKLDFIIEDQLLQVEPEDGDRWYVDHFEDRHPGYRKVVCFPTWILLSNLSRFGSFPIAGKTPHEGLEQILLNTGWTAGDPPASASLYTYEGVDANVLNLIWRWAEVTGYEVEFDGVAKTVTFVNTTGENRGYGFIYGHNIRQITRKFQGPEATRLYAVGANDLTIEGSNPTGLPYIEDYSWYTNQGLLESEARDLYRKDAIWHDDGYLLSINLFDAAVARLDILAQPRISYSGTVVDITRLLTGVRDPRFFIGDTVRVTDEVLGFDVITRITRIVRFPVDPRSDEIELGFSTSTLMSSTSARTSSVGELTPIVSTNDDDITVGPSQSSYGAISLTSAGNAVILSGSTFVGTATGTGTVEFNMTVDGSIIGSAYSFPFINGQMVEFSFPSFATDLAEGAHDIRWRAQVVSGSGTILLPALAGRSWVLARGAVGVGGSNPSAFVSETLTTEFVAMSNEEWTIEFISLVDITLDIEEEFLPEYDPPTDILMIPFTVGDPVFGTLGGPAGLL